MTFMSPLFVSHGAPNLVLYPTPAREFLASLGKAGPRPDAILVASAHYEADRPMLSGDDKPAMIYDFGGFERELFAMRYPAPGSPALAETAASLIRQAGFAPVIETNRGYDHGTWVPLMLMYPQADIPVVQLSIEPQAGPQHHLELGRALAPLTRQNVLVIGSGAITHNLGAFFRGGFKRDDQAEPWVAAFADWVGARLAEGDVAALVDYRAKAPFARENHPSEDHVLPLFVALGAAGGGGAERVHASGQYGVLAMDVYRFDEAAAERRAA